MVLEEKLSGLQEHAGAAACCALACMLLSSYMLNQVLALAAVDIVASSREISLFSGGIVAVALAFVSYHKPSLMNEKICSSISLILLLASAVFLHFALSGAQEEKLLFMVLGRAAGSIASIWFLILVSVSFVNLGQKRAIVAISMGFAFQYVIRTVMSALGVVPGSNLAIVLYFFMTLVAYLLIRKSAQSILGDVKDPNAPAVMRVTNPRSYLSITNKLYIALLLFSMVCGNAFGCQASDLSSAIVSVCLFAAFCVLGITLATGAISIDRLYILATLLVLAGLLAMSFLAGTPNGGLGERGYAFLTEVGFEFYSMVMYYIIAVVGSGNRLGAVSVAAFAFAVKWIGIVLGSFVSALFQHFLVVSPPAALCVAITLTFVFVAYNFVFMGSGAIAKIVEDIAAVDIVVAAEQPISSDEEPCVDVAKGGKRILRESDFERACLSVASRAGLTKREAEILNLLSRGRTAPVIQERLVLSRNTVKTHVRHIYAKLNVHSQQEAIDMIESEAKRLSS